MADLLTRNADLLEELIRQRQDWKLIIRNGLLMGLASVIGATVVVALLVQVLKPFEQISELKPYLEKISRQLDGDKKNDPKPGSQPGR